MTESPIFIFGSGGHARVIRSLLPAGARNVSYVGEEAAPGVLSEENFFQLDHDKGLTKIYLGVGDNKIRAKLFEKVREAGFRLPALIGPGATVLEGAKIGEGVVVCPGAVVMASARIGHNVIVNTLSSVDHDCEVGDGSQLTAGVILGGGASIGRDCFLGIKSAVLPGLKLGDKTTVMAGAIVTKNFPQPGLVLAGFPAVPARLV